MDMCNGAWLLEKVVCLVEMFMGFVFLRVESIKRLEQTTRTGC